MILAYPAALVDMNLKSISKASSFQVTLTNISLRDLFVCYLTCLPD